MGKQHIKFSENLTGENGTKYIGGIKYGLLSEDRDYIYLLKDRIRKSNIKTLYEINNIIRENHRN